MGKPIRILHILQRMEAGGTQALLMNIYRNINRDKVQFDFLLEYPEKYFYDDEILSLGGNIYYTNLKNDLNIFRFLKTLKNILRTNNYSIVHMHTYSIGYFCLKMAKYCRVPIRIAHSHSNSMTNSKKYLKLLMQKLYTLDSTDLFACSKEAGEYLFKEKRFNILQNAIDSEKFIFKEENRINIRKRLGLEASFVVGHVGRFKPEKNHKFLIDVFLEIKKNHNNSNLLLIGNGDPNEEIINYISENGIRDDVIILKDIKEVNEYYSAMDVFVFPSQYEGFGIVGIEAQASGIPLICSEGIPEEANISPLYKKLDLKLGAKSWAREAILFSKNQFAFSNMQQYVIDAGFDIKKTTLSIEEFYLQKSKTIYTER